MDHAIIVLIVAVFVGLRAMLEKSKGAQKDSPSERPTTNNNLPPAEPQLTEADKRYREIQEEIRRRVVQRQQQPMQTSPAPAAPAPRRPRTVPNMGVPPRPAPKPISTYQRLTPAPQPAIPAPMVMPVATISPNTDAATMEAAATEAAAYALPESTPDESPVKYSYGPAPVANLKPLLASPSSARQAFVLREILDRPLSLRPVYCGGHENWL